MSSPDSIPDDTGSTADLPRHSFWRRLSRGMMIAAGGACLVALAAYGAIAYSYWSAEPVPTRNYTAELNQVAIDSAEESRAWPLYREAMLLTGRADSEWNEHDYRPGGDRWEDVKAYVQEHQEALATAREASRRPSLGFVLSDGIAPEDLELTWFKLEKPASENAPVLFVRTFAHERLHDFARLLAADARLAAETGDLARAIADIEAIVGIARQLREAPLSLIDRHACEVFAIAVVTWGELLQVHAEGLADHDPTRLNDAVRGFCDGRIHVRLAGDRMVLEDVVQRFYTDDGHGDGFLFLPTFEAGTGYPPDIWKRLSLPFVERTMAGRKETLAICDSLMDAAEEQCARPLWEVREWPWLREAARVVGDTRFAPLHNAFLDPIDAYFEAEEAAQIRDAILLAAALVSHRRETGAWPASIAELAPGLLTHEPLDRFDGRPLRYSIANDSPVVYSVGPDRDDDSAQPGATLEGADVESNWWLATVQKQARVANGDWVLWTGVP